MFYKKCQRFCPVEHSWASKKLLSQLKVLRPRYRFQNVTKEQQIHTPHKYHDRKYEQDCYSNNLEFFHLEPAKLDNSRLLVPEF